MSNLLRMPHTQLGVTLFLTLAYSLLRDTDLSTLLKPLPILFWALVVRVSLTRQGGACLFISLLCAALGDVLLDLGDHWLLVATVPFLGSTLMLAYAFQRRLSEAQRKFSVTIELLVLLPIIVGAIVFFSWTSPYLPDSSKTLGGLLLVLSCLLLWRAAMVAFFGSQDDTLSWFGFLGASGIVANYLLYSVDLYLQAIPRDLVIQLYFWGQALVAWSFLKHKPS